jgi:hypothetical protein
VSDSRHARYHHLEHLMTDAPRIAPIRHSIGKPSAYAELALRMAYLSRGERHARGWRSCARHGDEDGHQACDTAPEGTLAEDAYRLARRLTGQITMRKVDGWQTSP